MDLFNVYKRWNIEPVRGCGSTLWDAQGQEYLDLYGGHAVISIGHSHPHYVEAISRQIAKLGFSSIRADPRSWLSEALSTAAPAVPWA